MVLLHKRHRKRVEGRFASPGETVLAFAEKISDVQEHCHEEIERIKGLIFDLHGVIRIRRITTFHLNPYLPGYAAGVGMYANEVITLIVGWCLVCEDVPPHQI